MARSQTKFNKSTIQKRLAEGRGRGNGREYKPWIRVQNMASLGNVSRIKGWKTQRIHHLLSNLEADCFYILDFSPTVVDIREQFPLVLKETLSIAKQCGVKHPRIPNTGEPVVMTTDFLIDVEKNGRIAEHARTVKPAAMLSSARTREKFEIERRYWARRKVSWSIVTDLDISQTLVKNIRWVHPYADISGRLNLSREIVSRVEEVLWPILQNGVALAKGASTCDCQLQLVPGTSLTLMRHFVAARRWMVRMDIPINPQKPICFLS